CPPAVWAAVWDLPWREPSEQGGRRTPTRSFYIPSSLQSSSEPSSRSESFGAAHSCTVRSAAQTPHWTPPSSTQTICSPHQLPYGSSTCSLLRYEDRAM